MKALNLRSFSKRFAAPGLLCIIALSAFSATTAFAAPASTKCGATDTQCVIGVGNELIADRITALNKLNDKISGDLKANLINGDQASALQSDITTNETGLNNLKARLDAETTAKAARTDVMNIFLQFRIFAVVLPRDYRHLQADIEQRVMNLMQTSASTIQAAIAKAPASKQAKLNELFSDYKKHVASAESEIDTAQNDFPAMTPENFNLNRTAYEQTRKAVVESVKDARADLHKAADDLKDMTSLLGI